MTRLHFSSPEYPRPAAGDANGMKKARRAPGFSVRYNQLQDQRPAVLEVSTFQTTGVQRLSVSEFRLPPT